LKEILQPGLEDLKNIINECASGNARAQEKLYRMFAPKMFGVCLRYAKDRTEAEDNLQDGFMKVFSNIKSFRHEGSFEGWVRRIMVNVSLSKFRKQHVLYNLLKTWENSIRCSFRMTFWQKSGRKSCLELVQQLPPRYRMVFNLFVMEGMNHQEIRRSYEHFGGNIEIEPCTGKGYFKT
jgi:RNA polymerase sigma factor (sigma-70 family)